MSSERELVLVHGRAQEGKDSIALKAEWLAALHRGLAKIGRTLPIPEERVRFPFYGDTLFDLVRDLPADQVARVVVRGEVSAAIARGSAEDPAMAEFMNAVLDEVREELEISEQEVAAEALAQGGGIGTSQASAQVSAQAGGGVGGQAVVIERGVLNARWVQALLSVVDRKVPGGSGLGIALATKDVYRYLNDLAVRDVIESGVRQAMTPGRESIVVSHSLGTVVAYNLLRREGAQHGWRVPTFITLGSPLAVTRIRSALRPIGRPDCVGDWFNAMDPDDVVALFPLDDTHFPVDPPIENKTDVRNHTGNQHGIAGYLDDPVVARRIYDALVAP